MWRANQEHGEPGATAEPWRAGAHGGGGWWLWAWTAGVALTYAYMAYRTAPVGIVPCAPSGTKGAESATHDDAAPKPAAEDVPAVSIVVPARNEERNIQACVESLLEQRYPRLEVIVVDDGSRDATPQLLDLIRRQHPCAKRLRVVRVDDLPTGWAGKPHALHVGATQAHGDWLLFTDADTRHAPDAVRTAVECAQREGAHLFTIVTGQELPGFWNRVLMPVASMGISLQYPARLVNDPHTDVAIANGQFILIRRAVYEALGGYAEPRLRATLLDDRDLAQEVKRAGYRLVMTDGRALVRTQMYQGLREHWHGWSKNVYVGSRGGPLTFAFLTLSLAFSSIAPFALLAAGLARRRPSWSAAGVLQVAATVLYRARVDVALGIPRRYAWTHPLGGALFTALLASAGLRKLTGHGVEWRGRTYEA